MEKELRSAMLPWTPQHCNIRDILGKEEATLDILRSSGIKIAISPYLIKGCLNGLGIYRIHRRVGRNYRSLCLTSRKLQNDYNWSSCGLVMVRNGLNIFS